MHGAPGVISLAPGHDLDLYGFFPYFVVQKVVSSPLTRHGERSDVQPRGFVSPTPGHSDDPFDNVVVIDPGVQFSRTPGQVGGAYHARSGWRRTSDPSTAT